MSQLVETAGLKNVRTLRRVLMKKAMTSQRDPSLISVMLDESTSSFQHQPSFFIIYVKTEIVLNTTILILMK